MKIRRSQKGNERCCWANDNAIFILIIDHDNVDTSGVNVYETAREDKKRETIDLATRVA